MAEFFVLLNFWCAAADMGAACSSTVTPVWYPTEEACETRAQYNRQVLTDTVELGGGEIYNLVVKCMPMERRVLGPTH